MILARLIFLVFLLILLVLQNRKIVLIQLAKVHHLEVRDHLFVLQMQVFAEGLVRNDRYKEHIEVLESNARTVLIVHVQEPVEVQMASARSTLKYDHRNQTGQVSSYDQPIDYLVADLVAK